MPDLFASAETFASAYFGVMILVALAEWAVPRRRPADILGLRWFSNLGIAILDAIVLRALFPLAAITWAAVCSERGWGLLNLVDWPWPVVGLLALISLDFPVYGQHYLLHRVPVLWRMHRTHHSDADFDLTTGLRFHPLEAVLNNVITLATIALIGAPAAAVLAWEFLGLLTSFGQHANVRIPRAMDRVLRMVFVTPDMHRIHHSQGAREGRSNLSNLFSWWDRLFGTYIDQPSTGYDNIRIGLAEYAARKHATLPWMLVQPFLSDSEPRAAADAPVVISEAIGGR